MEKVVKIRKKRRCSNCDKRHKAGEYMTYMEGKQPVYETDQIDAINGFDGKQVGIEYYKRWYCYNIIDKIISCV